MNKTNIGWTDFTSNPIRYWDTTGKTVHACERISPACAHCYAATLAKRYGRGERATREGEKDRAMTEREISAWVDWIEWLAFIREDLTPAERFQLKIEMFERFAYNIATARAVTGWL